MSMSLQLRDNIQELMFSDKYDTDDTEQLIERRFEKKPPIPKPNDIIENPLMRRVEKLMGVRLDHAALRDHYFSQAPGTGYVFVFPFGGNGHFLALDLFRSKLEQDDIVTVAVCCDARKCVKLTELFEILQQNSSAEVKLPLKEAPLVKAVLEQQGGFIYYKGDKIPVADEELMKSIML